MSRPNISLDFSQHIQGVVQPWQLCCHSHLPPLSSLLDICHFLIASIIEAEIKEINRNKRNKLGLSCACMDPHKSISISLLLAVCCIRVAGCYCCLTAGVLLTKLVYGNSCLTHTDTQTHCSQGNTNSLAQDKLFDHASIIGQFATSFAVEMLDINT